VLGSAACSHPVAPSASSAPVDVLPYLLGDAALWPRNGSHYQNQIVDLARREVCWLKYGNPRRFECWRWDDQWVYHAVDHALDGDSNESYRFTDGRWLPRYLPAGASASMPWTIDLPDNQIVWYDAACTLDPSRSRAFPYRQRAWLEPRADAAGALLLRTGCGLVRVGTGGVLRRLQPRRRPGDPDGPRRLVRRARLVQ
jgi:hypothetical protein